MKRLLILILFVMIPKGLYAESCWITSISPLNFLYDLALTAPTDATGSITIMCDSRVLKVKISLDRGIYSMDYSARLMKHDTLNEFLRYNLFISADRNTVWGDGTGGSSTVVIDGWKNKSSTAIIYGRIFPNQNVSAGNYTDRVTVTIFP